MASQTATIAIVDAFTAEPFRGNPAAVCLLDAPADEAWMQAVAAEMNLSETAFLVREDDGFRLRWFTPACEVKLCGHATLASSHRLWESGIVPPATPIAFKTRSGTLRAARSGGWIELDFPALPSTPVPEPKDVVAALGVCAISSHRVPAEAIGEPTVVIELESEAEIRQVEPDFEWLRDSGPCVIVTARADEGAAYDFVSRFFGPAVGIDEDPVTGAAHCVLAPYWAAKLDKLELMGFQASKRGGHVGVKVAGDRVILRGHAVTVLEGKLTI